LNSVISNDEKTGKKGNRFQTKYSAYKVINTANSKTQQIFVHYKILIINNKLIYY